MRTRPGRFSFLLQPNVDSPEVTAKSIKTTATNAHSNGANSLGPPKFKGGPIIINAAAKPFYK